MGNPVLHFYNLARRNAHRHSFKQGWIWDVESVNDFFPVALKIKHNHTNARQVLYLWATPPPVLGFGF